MMIGFGFTAFLILILAIHACFQNSRITKLERKGK